MNITFSNLRLAAIPALLSVMLAGCAGSRAQDAHAQQPARGSSDGRGGMQGQQGMMMDMEAMCEMHKQQMAGKSPQERQSMMDERMRTMSPEMRTRVQAMMEQCR